MGLKYEPSSEPLHVSVDLIQRCLFREVGQKADAERSETRLARGLGKSPVADFLYRGTSVIRNSAPLGPYSRTIPRVIWWS